ncbi:Hint domain-containing protein [Sphingomonas prati]|uniref:Autotransporter passenger strand-loop-strand repeat protein n=1 Tax=Sphingomonas prati TaxID=1843237 RepID=A0A7W9BTY5_9SPHN|nr:Hint domain-containing protein [Sphingomonas prati]MBB5730071.1 autotransporter passenger strand-loop-strand repeat protein [Sphingomonas prati]GGE91221.1 hypothetical protein GCM10011404_25220 [Sphingomonas prati]
MTETIVGDGQSAPSSLILNNGDILRLIGPDQSLNNGPYASFVTVNSGGVMTVDYGRVDGNSINVGGEYFLNAGSTDFGTIIRGGIEHIAAGASATNGFIQDGGIQYVSGSVRDMFVASGGKMVITEAGYDGASPVAGAAPDTTYMQAITVGFGGDLRLVSGRPDSITLQQGGTITIPSIRYDASVTLSNDVDKGLLQVQGSSTYPIQVSLVNANTTRFIVYGNAAGETVVSAEAVPVCFCRGTAISTPDGLRSVEDIAIGDLVTTAAGDAKPVVWIGGGSAPARGDARPVIVRRDAFAMGVPMRDLRVTRGHSFLFGRVLIPIGELINGRSILWDEDADRVDYHHLELADHDILLAEGAPAESYRNDGNRDAFCFADGCLNETVAMPPCAPIVSEGPAVDAVWRSLADRAGADDRVVTDDPDLHLMVDDVRVDPCMIDGNFYGFRVGAGTGDIRIGSRHAVPAFTRSARDFRQLGVALRGFLVRDASGETQVAAATPDWGSGFHAVEEGAFRWTNGAAMLPKRHHARHGEMEVVLNVHCFAQYPA